MENTQMSNFKQPSGTGKDGSACDEEGEGILGG